MKKLLIGLLGASLATTVFAAEVPLCALPQVGSTNGDADPGCAQIIAGAKKVASDAKTNPSFTNAAAIPAQLIVGAVYLQPITMAPAGMMRARADSDIHLEVDIHAKAKLKSRGFAPGDWLPNVNVNYIIQKVGSTKPLTCGAGMDSTPSQTVCKLMPMVASDGTHYGDNVKLDGPGFYLVTFDAQTDPMFGWHTDTDSKILGTEFVNWKFKQMYLFKWTGIGKKGGY